MSERAPTLAQLRAEARAKAMAEHAPEYGGWLAHADDGAGWLCLMRMTINAGPRIFKSEKAALRAARRFALETLRQLPGKESP